VKTKQKKIYKTHIWFKIITLALTHKLCTIISLNDQGISTKHCSLNGLISGPTKAKQNLTSLTQKSTTMISNKKKLWRVCVLQKRKINPTCQPSGWIEQRKALKTLTPLQPQKKSLNEMGFCKVRLLLCPFFDFTWMTLKKCSWFKQVEIWSQTNPFFLSPFFIWSGLRNENNCLHPFNSHHYVRVSFLKRIFNKKIKVTSASNFF